MKFLDQMWQYSPDGGGNSGGGSPGTTTANAAGAGDEAGENSGEDPEEDLTPPQIPSEYQDAVNRIVQDRVAREKEKQERAIEEAQRKAKQEAEETRLAEKQEWQTLATKRQETIQELEGQVEQLQNVEKQAKRYEKALKGYVDQMLAAVPEYVQELLKGRDVADQLEWLTSHRSEFESQEDGKRPPLYVGPPPAPGTKGAGNGPTPDQRRKKAYRPSM